MEWLIYDDSETESFHVGAFAGSQITYVYDPRPHTVGEKRNRLIEAAKGQYIVHFDDDDYYGPTYVSTMLRGLQDASADIVKLDGTYIFDEKEKDLLYLDFHAETYLHYVCMPRFRRSISVSQGEARKPSDNHKLGYGFCYVYKRSVWEGNRFPTLNFGEDLAFMLQAMKSKKLAFVEGSTGICLHVIHHDNLSGCFPQYLLPRFLLEKLFPHAYKIYGKSTH